MSTTPDPARLAQYEARLAELVATRDTHRAQHDDHKVRLFNRRIQAQIKWIRRARAGQDVEGGPMASKKSKVKSNRSINHRAEAQRRRQAIRDLSPRTSEAPVPGEPGVE